MGDLLDLAWVDKLGCGRQKFVGLFGNGIYDFVVFRKISSLISSIRSEEIEVHDIEIFCRYYTFLDDKSLISWDLICE